MLITTPAQAHNVRRAEVAGRVALRIAAGLVLALAAPHLPAQSYPAKPVRLIIPAAPGGGTDIIARTIGHKLNELLKQNVLIENRAGGSTNIGTEVVARAAPDGYTVLMASTPHAINPSLFAKLNFDPIRDFTPISQLATVQTVFVVHPALPARNVKEFIALAKSRPGQLTAGTSAGTSQQLAVELFKVMAKIDALNIPYKGAGAALTDTIAGHVQFQVNTLVATLPYISSGRLRALGVCGPKRSPILPELPTVGETLKGFESAGWYGLLGPAGLPRDITTKLHESFKSALSDPVIRERLASQGVDIVAGSPEELSAFLGREIPKWAVVVKAAGLKPN
jgi:tripartite-type tricarboxylate transporter receptor subunit TctC